MDTTGEWKIPIIDELERQSFPTPYIGEENAVDPRDILDIRCRSCLQSIPHHLSIEHVRWHDRTNLLFRIRDWQRGGSTRPLKYGKDVWGRLYAIDLGRSMWRYRNDLVEGVGNALKVVCTIPHRDEGILYTFGNSYEGRDAQGEYVFLTLSEFGAWTFPHAPESIFRFSIENDKLWISSSIDAESPNQTRLCVNGLPLLQSKELVFGDIISVYTGLGDAQAFRDFVFGPACLTPNPSLGADSPLVSTAGHEADITSVVEPDPLQNPVILSNVLLHTPVNAVKRMRMLSALWNEEGAKTLRNRTTAHILCSRFNEKPAYLSNIAQFCSSRMFKCPAWAVDLTQLTGSFEEMRSKERKLQDDIADLVSAASHVTELSIAIDKLSLVNIAVLEKLLRGVQFSLKNLYLSVSTWTPFPALVALTLPDFTNLQNVVLNFCRWTKSEIENPLVSSLAKSIRNVKRLRFVEHKRFPVLMLTYMIGSKCIDTSSFANLSRLDIAMGKDFKSYETLQNLALPNIKQIKLLNLNGRDVERVKLSHVLDQWRQNLITLELWYKVGEELQINFPWRMEKLQSLKIFVKLKNVSQAVSTKFSFGLYDLQPRMDWFRLPVLREFNLWPASKTTSMGYGGQLTCATNSDLRWNCFLPVLSAFIGSGTDAAEAVNLVNIPFTMRHQYHVILDQLEVVFPNCSFPELAEARRASQV